MSPDHYPVRAVTDRPTTATGGWALGLALVGCCLIGNVISAKLAFDILRDDRRSRRDDRTAVSLAIAALAVDALVVGTTVVVAYAYLGLGLSSLEDGRVARTATNANPDAVASLDRLVPGTCLRFSDGGPDVVVTCRAEHDAEVYARLRISGDGYPGQAVVERTARRCEGRPFRDFVGTARQRSRLDSYHYYPDAQQWSEADRYVACALADPAGPRTGSARGSRR